MSVTLLNDQDYYQILQRRFGRSDIKFISSSLKLFSKNVEGFMGDHYKLNITYKLDDKVQTEHFFIKTKMKNNQIKKNKIYETMVYRLETFLYNFLFREFEKYGLDTSFAPKCYHCVEEETLVLEDMTEKGFSITERNKFYNEHECKSGLQTLALLHASGFLYEQIKSKELGRIFQLNEEYPEIFEEKVFTQFIDPCNQNGVEWINMCVSTLLEVIQFMPESDEYKNEFKKVLRGIEVGRHFSEETNIKKFFGHGDLWSNNIFFKSENGTTAQCCIVDYQVCRYFYSTYDVILFLNSNTNRKFRNNHLENLLEFYYASLRDVMARHGYSICDFFPKDDYEKSLDIVEFDAKLIAYSTRALVNLPVELLNRYATEGGDSLNEVLFINRPAITADACKNNEQYKNMLIDDLYDLHHSLFKV